MKVEHHLEGNRCIHCGTGDASATLCRLNGKTVTVGDAVGREPFRSCFEDLGAIGDRMRELFPKPKEDKPLGEK